MRPSLVILTLDRALDAAGLAMGVSFLPPSLRAFSTTSHLPHHLLAEAVDLAFAGESDEAHRSALAGLEADGGPRRNVEPEAARLRAVELERRVGLEEMVVGADLDRPVAGIRDLERDGL